MYEIVLLGQHDYHKLPKLKLAQLQFEKAENLKLTKVSKKTAVSSGSKDISRGKEIAFYSIYEF